MVALTIPMDPASPVPLHRQLYAYLRDAILEGRLAPGERMPSTRSLSESLGVSRTTVTLGYEQLLSEGYLETAVGSGTYVSRRLPGDLLPGSGPPDPADIRVRLSMYGKHVREAGPFDRRAPSLPVNFRHGRADYTRFPMAIWRRLLLRHCRANEPAMLDYAVDGQGYTPLREAIARYISRARAVRCTAEQVVIVNGSQQALDLIARVLLDRGDTAAIEDPCYAGARRAFEAQGAQLLPAPVDASGLVVERLKRSAARKPRLVYVTPSHQFPSGFVLSLARRLELLDWAERSGAVIVEDDYDSEYRYEGHPLPSVQGLEEKGRVLYTGTFSKVLFPSLRIGYIVAPRALATVLARAKWLSDRQAPLLEQYALADFIQLGHLERHIRRMRKLYDHRRRVLVAALQRLGPRTTVQGENAGMHILVRLHTRLSADEVVRRAAREGVGITSAAQYYIKARHSNEFVLGYANLTDEQIEDGVRRIARAIDHRGGAEYAEVKAF